MRAAIVLLVLSAAPAALAQEVPARETPAQQTHARQTPAQQTPAQQTPAQQTPAQQTPAQQTPAQQTPALGAATLDAPTSDAAPSRAPAPGTAVALVLLAPDAVRAPWTAALQVELAAGGRVVVPMPPPDGATPLIRDAAAQAAALAHGADAAVRVEATPSGWTIRVVRVDDTSARGAPIAREADPRTAALIVTSLLEDAPLPPPPVAAPPPSETLATPAPYVREAPPPTRPPGPTVRAVALIGTMGFALANDRHVIPGSGLRGGIGLRYDAFEAALLGEAALLVDDQSGQGTELQPFLRACLEFGAAIAPTADVGIHLGLRGCGGYVEYRERVFEPVFPDGPGTPIGERVFSDRGGAMGAAGGYLAVSFALADATRLYVRADVEGDALEPSPHFGEVMTMLSGMLAFE